MPYVLEMAVPGTIGNDKGASVDGVLVGKMTPAPLSKLLLASFSLPALCITDDGGLYVNDTADFASAAANDVTLLPNPAAVDDAVYFGNADGQFTTLNIVIGTSGAGTWTVQWQYWNGTAWAALAGVTDGTSAFTAAPGTRTVTFTQPVDWVRNTVDSVLAYWIRANVQTFTGQTVAPLATSGNLVAAAGTPVFVDDTVDANDADAGDVALLPATPTVNDAVYVGHGARFCKVKVTTSQARAGTLTLVLEYWNGASWAALATLDDDTVSFTAAPGTYFLHFVPPADWQANTGANGPNGQSGWFVRWRISAFTSMTTQPLATQLWVLPLTAGATGVRVNGTTTLTRVTGNAQVVSGSTADSVFLLVNATAGTWAVFTWTKAVNLVAAVVSLAAALDAELLLVQITEDGTTEFQNADFFLSLA